MQTYSDEISDLKEIEEGPEERDEEAGDDDEEEPVIVTDAKGLILKASISPGFHPHSWRGARHANDPQYLELIKNNLLELFIFSHKSFLLKTNKQNSLL